MEGVALKHVCMYICMFPVVIDQSFKYNVHDLIAVFGEFFRDTRHKKHIRVVFIQRARSLVNSWSHDI